ncbi:MAG: histidinol dehydrogenase [Gemmatimonadota bacterium]|nr:MAG: histidinol dehydrogenase [Gemmatimonadota bacterium]
MSKARPTGRTARSVGDLTVLSFLRVRTWLGCNGVVDMEQLIDDSAWLARQEGLEEHAQAAEMRRSRSSRYPGPSMRRRPRGDRVLTPGGSPGLVRQLWGWI